MRPIYVYIVKGKTKDGNDFTAYETTDTKDKKRLSVRFVQDGDSPIKEACTIAVNEGWVDKRGKYPVLRVRSYSVVETPEKPDTLGEFFD